jgi:ABC-2 type transport system permease protein
MTLQKNLELYWNETRFEFLKLLRMPVYSLSSIGYPLLFYIMFGLVLPTSRIKGAGMEQYLLGSYGAFGAISAVLFALGSGIAVERGLGWMSLKRASPMPPQAYLAAKIIAGLSFSFIVVVILFLAGWLLGGVQLPFLQWVQACALLVLGTLPFTLLGILIGLLTGPNSAQGVINMIHLPLAFFSGLWIPVALLPAKLQAAAAFLPYYHLGQIGLASVGARNHSNTLQHFGALAAFSLLFGALILWAQRRQQETIVW